MSTLVDRTGDRYGMLTVLARGVNNKHGKATWFCECDCGEFKTIVGGNLASDMSRSCGCVGLAASTARAASMVTDYIEATGKHPTTTHGLTKHVLYGTWNTMKQRCTNPNSPDYPRYGGRGIKVCDAWMLSFPQFLDDMGEKPDSSLSIDRIENDKGYYPENCRWATPLEQAANKG